ncbi:MAG: glycosyltransferase family 2 protein [Verrucomicrobiota bacterium]
MVNPESLKSQEVSVVITTHARPEMLDRAIESAVTQGRFIREIIVCEDGDDHGTMTVINRWKALDSRIRHVRVKSKSRGPALGRNMGILHSVSDWVGFLDDDDEWLPHKIESQLAVSNGVDVVCGNATRRNGGSYFEARHSPQFSPQQILLRNPIILSTALVRRATIGNHELFLDQPEVRGSEDCLAWKSMSARGARFRFLDSHLVIYDDTQQPDRLSNQRLTVARAIAAEARQEFQADPLSIGWLRTAVELTVRAQILAVLALPLLPNGSSAS